MSSSAKWICYFIHAGTASYLIDMYNRFLIIPRAPAITGTVIFLRCLMFSISLNRSFDLFILYHSLTNILSTVTAISILILKNNNHRLCVTYEKVNYVSERRTHVTKWIQDLKQIGEKYLFDWF